MKRRALFGLATAGALVLAAAPSFAQDVTLRLHQFLPPAANLPKNMLVPWAERLKEASDGRIEIQMFDAMALGGAPNALLDQARDGVVDISMTLSGYTPGRFPRTEVFELPFMMSDPVATAVSFWQMIESDFQANEYADVKVLSGWVHGPGVIHTKDPVTRLEDMQGKTLRAPTRIITDLLGELGATAVGMPLPAVPEALSKGVINGTVIPWEVTPAMKLSELVTNHAEFGGTEALYTATFVLVMNQDRFDALPDDLKAIIEAESGEKLARFAGEVMFEYDKPARDIAAAAGNTITTLDDAETARWKEAAQPVYARWIAEMKDKGIDGQALIDEARAHIAANSGK